jgi:hypothetical protein
MNADWIGLIFLLLLLAVAFVGLKTLSKNRQSTEQEFEKRADEGASLLTAGVEAINGMLNPSAAKGKEAVTEVKRGDYQKKKQGGKSLGKENGED